MGTGKEGRDGTGHLPFPSEGLTLAVDLRGELSSPPHPTNCNPTDNLRAGACRFFYTMIQDGDKWLLGHSPETTGMRYQFLSLLLWFSGPGDFEPLGDIWKYLETVLAETTGRGLLTSSG